MRNVYSIILASVLLFSSNVNAEQTAAGVATDYPDALVLVPEACDETTSELIVGMRACKENKILKFADTVGIFAAEDMKFAGYNPTNKNLDESTSVKVVAWIKNSFHFIGLAFAAVMFFCAGLILVLKSGNKDFKGIWQDRSSKFTVNSLYGLVFAFSSNKISLLLTLLATGLVSAILSLYVWLTYNKTDSELAAYENESLEAGKSFASSLINTAREMEDTKVAMFNNAVDWHIRNSDDSMKEIIEDFNENFKYSMKVQKVNKSNWDATLNLTNIYNKYDFVNSISIAKKPTNRPQVYGYSPIEPVASFHADNTIFKSLEGGLTETVNDGTILSAFSEANTKVASSLNIKQVLSIIEAEIKTAKLNNSYSDKMPLGNINEQLKQFAKNNSSGFISEVNAQTKHQGDFKYLVAQGMKVLSNSAWGFNSKSTIADWQDYANEIPALEKELACSKDYMQAEYNHLIFDDYDANLTPTQNMSKAGLTFNSCIRLNGDSFEAIGFDSQAEPERYLDLMATVEAKKLTLQRASAAIRIGFFNASEELVNATNEQNEKNNTEKEKLQLNEAIKEGLQGFTKHYANIMIATTSRDVTRDAFMQTSDYVYHGREDGYINTQVLFNKPLGNELSEQQKSFLEKYNNLYDDSISVNTSLRDYSSIDALSSSAQTEEKDIMLWVESLFFDMRPLKNYIGADANTELGAAMRACDKSDTCKPKVSTSQFLSAMGGSVATSGAIIIFTHKAIQIVKSFVDTAIGAESIGSASNKKSNGGIAKAAGKLIAVPVFILNLLEAGFDIAANVAWPLMAISLFFFKVVPMIPYLLSAFCTLLYIVYLLMFHIFGAPMAVIQCTNERFSIGSHFMNVFMNHMRIVVNTIMIIVYLLVDQYLPVGSEIISLGAVLYTDLAGKITFIVLVFFICGAMQTYFSYLVLEGSNWVMEKIGGDRSILDTSVLTKAVVLGKMTELTYTVKNKLNERTDKKLAEIERQKQTENLRAAKEQVMIKHNANKPEQPQA
ncbi:TPA: hypothetical protein ACXK4S_000671 [Pseudomonas aeruginosa]